MKIILIEMEKKKLQNKRLFWKISYRLHRMSSKCKKFTYCL